jgi:hypothetical protein
MGVFRKRIVIPDAAKQSGIHTHRSPRDDLPRDLADLWLWIAGSRLAAARRNDVKY